MEAKSAGATRSNSSMFLTELYASSGCSTVPHVAAPADKALFADMQEAQEPSIQRAKILPRFSWSPPSQNRRGLAPEGGPAFLTDVERRKELRGWRWKCLCRHQSCI